MSYRQTVEASHRTTYANNIQLVAQEMAHKIRAAVTTQSGLTGDSHNVADLLAKGEYQKGEDYSHDAPNNRSVLDAVWLTRPLVIESGEVIYKEDKFDLAMDPTSRFNENHVRAVERGVFDTILGVERKSGGGFKIAGGGILGQRVTGKARTPASLPAGQYLLPGGTGMTLDKLNAAREALELADWGLDDDLSDELFCMISPKQTTDLLNIAAATKVNLNAFDLQQLQAGRPTSLFGATWLFTNRLPTDSSGNRICPMWTRSNVVAGFWQDVQGDMYNRSDAKNRPYVVVDTYPAATRLEDEGVVAIPCVES